MKANFKIFDTTLRDGSYAINFGFTARDTAIIAGKLEEAGIPYIELAHGVGLNGGSKAGKGAATDEEYLQAAAETLTTSKFGAFCIAGLCRFEDLDMAARNGMHFVRVGTNATEVEKSQPYIEHAKKLGMEVMANYMKSYTLPPKEFAKNALKSQSYGAEIVYVVDSAGGMFPEDVRAYYDAVREVSDIPLGFHGHNNLMLGNANAIEAIKVGYDIVDSSLQGMGRSAGNTCTETLVAALIKMGYDLDIDYRLLLDIGLNYIIPIFKNNGRHPLDITAGFADFHSSYVKYIHKYSAKYGVDPIELIQEYVKIDKININEEELDAVATKLEEQKDLYLGKYNFNQYFGEEQT